MTVDKLIQRVKGYIDAISDSHIDIVNMANTATQRVVESRESRSGSYEQRNHRTSAAFNLTRIARLMRGQAERLLNAATEFESVVKELNLDD